MLTQRVSGWVTAAVMVRPDEDEPRRARGNGLVPRTPDTPLIPTPPGQAFAEYGRIDDTLHLLSILDPIDDAYRRKLNKQLTVQESRHRLAAQPARPRPPRMSWPAMPAPPLPRPMGCGSSAR
nr:Tn3 family transposase [Nonomuraea candida]